MTKLLRVGVIGIGRRWRRRYRPALNALRDRYQVRAVYDAIQQRAVEESRELGCDAATGFTRLLERNDVDVLLLIDAQWFGLWPIELACRFRKPVLCCPPLSIDAGHADAILQQVKESGLLVIVEWLPRLAPATARLRELLANELGPVRLLFGDQHQPWRCAEDLVSADTVSPVLGPAGMALLQWYVSFAGSKPVSVLASAGPPADWSCVRMTFANGVAGQVAHYRSADTCPRWQLEVIAERGSVRISLPGRVTWTLPDGRHAHQLPRSRPLVELVLEQFHHSVCEGHAAEATLAEAHRVLGWLRAAEQSRREGQRVLLSAEHVSC